MEPASIVEALLFASQEPLTAAEMTRAIREAAREARETAESGEPAGEKNPLEEISEEQILQALRHLVAHYEADGRAFTLIERSSGWRLCARSEFAPWCRALYPGKKASKLSAPALETLAIIAYRQPITKSAIEAVRGVSVDGVMQQLLDRELVKIEGRAELPGRPLLYATTEQFLDHFGIRNIEELPNSAELRRVKLPEPEAEAAAPAAEAEPAALPLNAGEPETGPA